MGSNPITSIWIHGVIEAHETEDLRAKVQILLDPIFGILSLCVDLDILVE